MSTFLELVQELQEESGSSGDQIGSVVSQTGENLRLVNWIKKSDFYIQNRWLNWKFLWNQVTLSTTTGGESLSAPTDLNFWDYKTFRTNDGGVNDLDEPVISQEHDISKTLIRDLTQGRISTIYIMPDNTIEFEPIPDAVYQVKADYFRKPTLMAANGDVSSIPEEYHQAILGRGLVLYANYEGAEEVKVQGQEIFDEVFGRLENHQLPNQRFSRFQSTGSFFEVSANEGGGGFIVGDGGSY